MDLAYFLVIGLVAGPLASQVMGKGIGLLPRWQSAWSALALIRRLQRGRFIASRY